MKKTLMDLMFLEYPESETLKWTVGFHPGSNSLWLRVEDKNGHNLGRFSFERGTDYEVAKTVMLAIGFKEHTNDVE